MDPTDIERLAADPRFIPGVYNYCDRWCERCPLSHRCLTYAMEESWTAGDPAARDVHYQAFWDRLHEALRATLEMLREDARKRGVDLDAPDAEWEGRWVAREKRREAVQHHPLVVGAKDYARSVGQWFESAEASVRDAIRAASAADQAAARCPDELGQLQELMEVVRWYQYFIGAKLNRAVTAGLNEDAEGYAVLGDQPRDSDGSAKIALIAIDRSLAAWSAIRERMPGEGDAILDLLLLLARLRKGAEGRFPEARAFKRPGFDERLESLERGE